MDFILHLSDGTPESYHVQNFWITQDILNQAPIFARAKLTTASYVAILPDYSAYGINDLFQHIQKANNQFPWATKTKKVFWRGTPSDLWKANTDNYSYAEIKALYSQRPRFIISKISNEFPDLIDAGIINIDPYNFIKNLKPFLLDENVIKNPESIPAHISFAYLPCLDGWMCTYPGYLWRLASNSLVFKNDSNQMLWFYKALKPYKHYIPVNYELGDLLEKIEWAKQNDALCQEIAENATKLALAELRDEDNFAYLYHALKKYESLQRFHTQELLTETQNSPDWVKVP